MFDFITRPKKNPQQPQSRQRKDEKSPFDRAARPFYTACRRSDRDHFLPPLTPSLSSVSLPSLLSLHIYKATGFTYRPTGKHAEFQPAAALLTLARRRQAQASALSLQ